MQERRRNQRLPHVEVNARVKIRKGLLRRTWVDVPVRDFTRNGLAFGGDLPLREGNKVQMSLQLRTETGDFTIEKATAILRNLRQEDGQTIYGVEFSPDNPDMVFNSLERIEGILRRYSELRSRLGQARPQR